MRSASGSKQRRKAAFRKKAAPESPPPSLKSQLDEERDEAIPPGLDEAINRAISDLHQINAVLRSGYVAALYSDWHDVSPLMLADIFRAASHLAYISIDQLERAALEDARLAREKSGRAS